MISSELKSILQSHRRAVVWGSFVHLVLVGNENVFFRTACEIIDSYKQTTKVLFTSVFYSDLWMKTNSNSSTPGGHATINLWLVCHN